MLTVRSTSSSVKPFTLTLKLPEVVATGGTHYGVKPFLDLEGKAVTIETWYAFATGLLGSLDADLDALRDLEALKLRIKIRIG